MAENNSTELRRNYKHGLCSGWRTGKWNGLYIVLRSMISRCAVTVTGIVKRLERNIPVEMAITFKGYITKKILTEIAKK